MLIALSLPSEAQIPRTLSYQGVLSDSLGSPKPDGAYSFTFQLYQTSTGGNDIWSEQKTLTVKHGLFSTALGDQVPFDTVAFDKPYWLGVTVGTDQELSPRISLTSVAYSLGQNPGDFDYAVFDANGTFVVPVGVSKVMIEVWGGGGGGGAGGDVANNQYVGGNGGGGAGGGYGKEVVHVTPHEVLNVTVGLGGQGGIPTSGQNGGGGGNGGSSSVWINGFSFVAANGGGGGGGGFAGSLTNGVPGHGGTSNAKMNAPGGGGFPGSAGGGAGGGGASISAWEDSINTPGGGGCGGAGAPAASGAHGSSGGNGRVIIWRWQ